MYFHNKTKELWKYVFLHSHVTMEMESHVTMEMSPMLLWKWICMSRENQAVTKPPNKK